jgi:plasmid stabilization system protein ParE
MTGYRLTRLAAADLADILRDTARRFGPRQRDAYASLIEAATPRVAANPERPASRLRPALAPALRSYHVEAADGRPGAAVHVLHYLPAPAVIIVRILHERMDPTRHVRGGDR